MEVQQSSSEVFFLEQILAKNERFILHHQKGIETANQLLRKQELERNHLLQQLYHPDTLVQDDNTTVEKIQMIPSKRNFKKNGITAICQI